MGPDAYNARRVAIAAGLPKSVPAFTVNRLCGSGLQAILSLRVVKHLRRTGGEFGIVTMCIGGGQALAALFRRLD